MLKARSAGIPDSLLKVHGLLLAAALLSAGLAAWLIWPSGPALAQAAVCQPSAGDDYDADDDGLIEVCNLAQLSAIRFDLDGDGSAGGSTIADAGDNYKAAFPGIVANGPSCPSGGCKGYELTADLDFDTNGNGEADDGDDYWNGGGGWVPIGRYAAVFEGNGHTIGNLYFRVKGRVYRGFALFEALAQTGVIRNVTLNDVDVSTLYSIGTKTGGLVGDNWGTISGADVIGTVAGYMYVGGLVGANKSGGTITDSYSSGEVQSTGDYVGGLVGDNYGGRIVRSWSTANVTAGVGEFVLDWRNSGGETGGLVGRSWSVTNSDREIIQQASIVGSYATGRVIGGERAVGGLVGRNYGEIFASYATGDVSGEDYSVGGLVGYNQGPVSASFALGAVNGSAKAKGLIGVHETHSIEKIRGAQRDGHRCIDCAIPNAKSGHGDRSYVTATYWNTEALGQTATLAVYRHSIIPSGTGRTPAELRQPTGYTGIYALWDDLRDFNGDSYAWDFGTSQDFPVLRDTGPSVAAQRALMPEQRDPNDGPNYLPLISQIKEWRNDPRYVSDKAHTDRWDRTLLAFGETVADTTLTPMTADEAQTYADRGWTRWTEVIAALRALEAADRQLQSPPPQQRGAPNQPPTVASAIADITIADESGTHTVSLSGVFSDAESDALTITAASSDEAVATVAISSDGSALTLTGVSEGTATITVTAQDTDGNRISDAFDVSVAGKHAALIAKMYEWRDDPCCASDKTHTDRWDRTLLAFGETVADTTLTPMTAAEAQALADRGWTRWTEVAAALRDIEAGGPQPGTPNRAPTVASALADVTIVNESGTQTVSLSGVFDDADSDSLTITAASSNEAVATVSVASDGSSLAVTAKTRGSATITVTADDGNGGTVDDAFTVAVKAAPAVSSAIADASLEVGGVQDISLSSVFSDADGDALTFSAASSDEDLVSANEFRGDLSIVAVAAGSATITVTAEDSDGNRVRDAFDVTVSAVPPVQQTPAQPEPDPTPTPEPETEPSDIVARYDTNGDGKIDRSEMAVAINDYIAGKITYPQVVEVNKAFQSS